MKAKLQVLICGIFFFGLSIFAWCKPAGDISDSELRKLAQFPKVSAEDILAGKWMSDFESYSLDQFPLRDGFRKVKAITYLYGLRQLDNNGIYVEDNYAVKMEYPFNTESIDYALGRFENVYQKCIAGSDAKCYVAVIPDKNYYLAKEHGALSMDYDALYSRIEAGMNYATSIELRDLISKDTFYRTDTHWNQVKLEEVADRIAGAMGAELTGNYQVNKASEPFYGVYYGQAALPMAPDDMEYLTNEAIMNAKVFDWQNNKEMSMYDESKMSTRSPYDLFLGGSLSFITIDNPLATTDKELVVFRDSFGSSLTPLLVSGYKKITIADIRYLPSDRIGYFVDFDKQDVLFLYSSLILNNSSTLK